MKKTFTLIIVALMLGSFTTFGQVIISQIYEGSSGFNKYIEITNIGTTSVNLASPQLYIKLFSNKTDVSATPNGIDTLAGTLNPGQCFILRHGKATTPAYAITYTPSDTSSTVANFNGAGTGTPPANTDIVALYNGTTLVDVFAWGTFQYLNQSYYRNATITAPNATWTVSEWTTVTNAVADAAAPNTIERLGYHPGGGPANPSILITAPANGSTITTANVNIAYTVSNFTIPTNGHIHYTVDGGAAVEDSSANPIALTGLSAGTHKVILTLVNKSHTALVPVVKDSVSFTINLSPTIDITAPANGSTIYTPNVNVAYSLVNFAIPTNGHIHYSVDGGAAVEDSSANPIALTGLNSGTHKVVITLVDKNHAAVVPVAKDSVSFMVNLAPTIDITSPADGATIYTPNTNIAFTVYNFNIPTDGHIHYNVDGGSYMMHYATTPIALTGLTNGSHKVMLMLVDTGHVALNPMVKDSVTFNVNLTPIKSIYQIQYTTLPTGDSPYKDSIVTTTGIVTASFASKYFIQDGIMPWNGLYVYDNTHSPAVGDSIVIKGTVSEYYNYTEMKTITNYTTIATGKTLPAPLALTTASVKSEQYEGMLVNITNAKCTDVHTTLGWWKVLQGVDTLEIGKLMFPFPTAVIGTYYNVTGCVNYTFSQFTVEPRKAADIEVYVGMAENTQDNFRLYPNPATSVLNLTDMDGVEQLRIINFLGETVNVYNISGNSASISVSDLNNGLYFISLMKDNTVMATRKFFKQ